MRDETKEKQQKEAEAIEFFVKKISLFAFENKDKFGLDELHSMSCFLSALQTMFALAFKSGGNPYELYEKSMNDAIESNKYLWKTE